MACPPPLGCRWWVGVPVSVRAVVRKKKELCLLLRHFFPDCSSCAKYTENRMTMIAANADSTPMMA
jgi:hypothetical protein